MIPSDVTEKVVRHGDNSENLLTLNHRFKKSASCRCFFICRLFLFHFHADKLDIQTKGWHVLITSCFCLSVWLSHLVSVPEDVSLSETRWDRSRKQICSAPSLPFSITGAVLQGYFEPAHDIYSLALKPRSLPLLIRLLFYYLHLHLSHFADSFMLNILPLQKQRKLLFSWWFKRLNRGRAAANRLYSCDLWAVTWEWRGVVEK